jgi:sugar/nucleoside kinase (ribokinase family)
MCSILPYTIDFDCICSPKSWVGRSVQLKAPNVEEGSTINCNGAGDAFTSGFLVASMLRQLDFDDHVSTVESLNLEVAAQFASLLALRHICSSTRDCDRLIIDDLLELSLNQKGTM